MFEDSLEGFVARWRPYAADAHLFPRVEGSPLLEVRAGGVILQVLERTGPYLSAPGRARVILNPTAQRLERGEAGEAGEARIHVTGLSAIEVEGRVLAREENFVVVDASTPLVVGVEDPLPDDLAAGDWVRFEARPPIHGFLVPVARRSVARSEDAESV